ncbi:hypothetical protein BST95_18185 [Halioglobus japonicus]|uniref:Uracil-DNA glycosylase-like domain-containing protein n=1 Tax=Halioglobus japonicus TaxID=930805 RepID=A0AAP8SPD5_9GAMM|nr:hypothetical protein [Halioglobus japonicus]AQA19891.1 hypothetical protein BST95_18185 [Halioglobus japonicus]PLW87033.1 hypothetical protein C0029_00040 [Halioglobus japonicus]GHD10568.1 hypothetical protein GCM10007052_09980 [Halioglobus japonicus]
MNSPLSTAADTIRRSHYLQAMGIDAYVSRRQLPGAAPTQRLAVIATMAPAPQSAPAHGRPDMRAEVPPMPTLEVDVGSRGSAVATEQAAAPAAPARHASPGVKFSLGVIICGDVAWLEVLQGMPLAREQVQLVHAMARAVGAQQAKPRVAQFDWPMHSNPQLDQGEDAARASLTAYLQRHLGEARCRALVSLGAPAAHWVSADMLQGVASVATLSTREMLDTPACKRQVWADLQPIVTA